jgi:hypothetical protein
MSLPGMAATGQPLWIARLSGTATALYRAASDRAV